jgi:hypothetical protein
MEKGGVGPCVPCEHAHCPASDGCMLCLDPGILSGGTMLPDDACGLVTARLGDNALRDGVARGDKSLIDGTARAVRSLRGGAVRGDKSPYAENLPEPIASRLQDLLLELAALVFFRESKPAFHRTVECGSPVGLTSKCAVSGRALEDSSPSRFIAGAIEAGAGAGAGAGDEIGCACLCTIQLKVVASALPCATQGLPMLGPLAAEATVATVREDHSAETLRGGLQGDVAPPRGVREKGSLPAEVRCPTGLDRAVAMTVCGL